MLFFQITDKIVGAICTKIIFTNSFEKIKKKKKASTTGCKKWREYQNVKRLPAILSFWEISLIKTAITYLIINKKKILEWK